MRSAKPAAYRATPLRAVRTGARWPQRPGGHAWRTDSAGRSTGRASNAHADVALMALAGQFHLLLTLAETLQLLVGMRTMAMWTTDAFFVQFRDLFLGAQR